MDSLNNAMTVEILATGKLLTVHGVRTRQIGEVNTVEVRVIEWHQSRWVQVAGPEPEARVIEYYPTTA